MNIGLKKKYTRFDSKEEGNAKFYIKPSVYVKMIKDDFVENKLIKVMYRCMQ